MFRLKNLNILGSKAELAALPEGKLLINTINAHSYNTARKDELFAVQMDKGEEPAEGKNSWMGSLRV